MPTPGLRQAALMACAATIFALSAPRAEAAIDFALLLGSVSANADIAVPVVVVVVERRTGKIAQRAFLNGKQAFKLVLDPGRYNVYAFADTDRDGLRDAGEAVSVAYAIAGPLRAGDQVELPALALPR